MARKILVDSSNTIDIWRQKVNQMSDYIEDLDGLDATFQPGNTWASGYPIDRDSNIVSAVDYIGVFTDNVYKSLITGTAASQQTITAKIFADSAVFDKLHANQLWNYDSAMTLGPTDSTWYGDSPGTVKFDFTADSAKFRNLNVINLREAPDSATFGQLTIGDSGFIRSITALDSTSVILFKNLKILDSSFVLDSALVLSKITVNTFIDSGVDSGITIDSAEVDYLRINNHMVFDGVEFDSETPFSIVGAGGVIRFGGYMLTDSTGV